MGLFAPFRRRPHERAGFGLYTASVAAARDPWFFGPGGAGGPDGLGVPDTLDGRFDVINLHVALLVRRLRNDPDPRGAALAQAVFDAMFSDMDVTLREMGVGDLAVGKRVKRMWEAFHGRALAYEAALDAGDEGALATALARTVWREDPSGAEGARPSPRASRLGRHAVGVAAALAGQDLAALLRGEVRFPPPVAAGPEAGAHAA
jgi:cytochrome b pre-mRNA-processing protein 3